MGKALYLALIKAAKPDINNYLILGALYIEIVPQLKAWLLLKMSQLPSIPIGQNFSFFCSSMERMEVRSLLNCEAFILAKVVLFRKNVRSLIYPRVYCLWAFKHQT